MFCINYCTFMLFLCLSNFVSKKKKLFEFLFLFNPLMKYAWCRKGNVRSASCGDASFFTSIGHLSWPTSTGIFFDHYRWKIFFCRDGLMLSWPHKCEYASFGRNKTSARKDDRSRLKRKHHRMTPIEHFITDIMHISLRDWIENSIADICREVSRLIFFSWHCSISF